PSTPTSTCATTCGRSERTLRSASRRLRLHHRRMDVQRHGVDRLGELGVELELLLLLEEVVVRLRLRELGLAVLTDHDERREEDRFQGDDQGQRRPRRLLE